MPYKDKDKRKEAQKRYRDNKRITDIGITPENVTPAVIPDVKPDLLLTDEMLALLPVGVSRPTWGTNYVRPDGERGWWDTPKYIILIYKLLTLTLTRLEAASVWIPAWRNTAGEQALVTRPTQQPTGATI